jgi:hypothetical protein
MKKKSENKPITKLTPKATPKKSSDDHYCSGVQLVRDAMIYRFR